MEISTISNAFGPTPSVKVLEAYKRYSHDTRVLNGLNMTVPVGKIYALLGSSGCGKSTLLNCIIGRCDLDAGTIILNVDRRSSIGFMPQDLCLYKELSIYENMLVFGYLNGMKKDRIIARGDELITLFELPPGDRFLETLSGGQQRRVSMVIAFLHDPSIVILDEPTVGVEINLTQKIWDYFIRQAVSGQTIIITTHYIQEAHKAHTVGMLRKGVLLAEEDPHSLMRRLEKNNLEDVFLQLSEEQQMQKPRYESRKENFICALNLWERIPSNIWWRTASGQSFLMSGFPLPGIQLRKPYFIDDNKKLSTKRVKSILYKNAVQLSRNYVFLCTILLVPIIQVFMFHLTYGKQPKDLKIGFVNEEISIGSCDRTNSSYNGCILSDDSFSLTCIYMDLFRNRTYELIEYSDEKSAVDAVKKNDVWAAVHFPKNYTQSLAIALRQDGIEARWAMKNSQINAWVDLSSHYIGKFVKTDIIMNYRELWKIALEQCGLSQKLLDYPGGIYFQPPLNVAGDSDSAVMSTAVSSMLIVMSVCLSSAAAAMIGIEEKLSGTILRMQAGGLSLYEFIISALIIQVVLHLVRIYISLTLYYWILGYTQRGSLLYIVLLMFCIGLLGILFGIISSVITTNPTVTMMIQNGFGYLVAFSSGLMWPIEGQPSVFRVFNDLFPITWSVSAARGITLQNLSSTNGIILGGFGMVILWTAILAVVVGLILKYRTDALIGN